MLPESFQDRRVTVMGLGRFGGGVAAARFLASHGVQLAITDLRPADQLEDSLKALADLPTGTALYLGGHPQEAFDDCEFLVVNPAVRPDNEIVARCRERGTLIISEIELFTAYNPAFTIAVTGSNGKSTTCQLIHDLLRANAESRRIWLGGNIGCSLLPKVEEIEPTDFVVLEVSSFQLHQLRGCGFRPDVAVVTNLSSNHLDWHPDLAHYRSSKQVISTSQRSTDAIVLPDDLDDWPVRARCLRFGREDSGEDGVYFEDGSLIIRMDETEVAERVVVPSSLQGRHNLRNLTSAVAASCVALGHPPEVQSAVRGFGGLPHRMQVVGRAMGRVFVDDSSSTTPESTMVALQSISSGCVLIAGGGDKGVDLRAMARQISQQTRAVVAIGETAAALAAAVECERHGENAPMVIRATDFESAFRSAVDLSLPGDMVLLSPGCSSHDWFTDFCERGETFAQLTGEWCQTRKDNG